MPYLSGAACRSWDRLDVIGTLGVGRYRVATALRKVASLTVPSAAKGRLKRRIAAAALPPAFSFADRKRRRALLRSVRCPEALGRLMRIAHVSIGALPAVFSEFGGAIQRRVGELAREQVRRGHEVLVLSPAAKRGSQDRRRRRSRLLALLDPAALGAHRVPAAGANHAAEEAAETRRHPRPQRTGARAARAACWLARWRSATTTSSSGAVARLPSTAVYRLLLRGFDLLLPCSEYCRTESAGYWQLPPERMTVCYNGVNVDEFRPDAEAGQSEREALDVSGPIILYVGRICSQKGTDTLLAAYRELRASRQDVKLVLVGPFEQFEARGSRSEDIWRRRIEAVGASISAWSRMGGSPRSTTPRTSS